MRRGEGRGRGSGDRVEDGARAEVAVEVAEEGLIARGRGPRTALPPAAPPAQPAAHQIRKEDGCRCL